jgi:peptidoglycan/LPS O-acetylase OafA/YrhL
MAWVSSGNERARNASARGGEILPLTSLRGLAASCVVIFHMNYWFYLQYWQHDPGPVLSTIFHVGYLDVDLFFVLSGYVITRAYLSWFRQPTLGHYATFLARRLARVWPLHLVALLLFIGAPSCSDPANILYNALMVHAWGFVGHFTCNDPSWSISCEWLVYLAFPGVAWLLTLAGEGRRAWLPALAALLGLGALAYFNPSHTLDLTYDNDLGAARALFGFTVGGALCRAFDHVSPGIAFDALALVVAAATALLAALGAPDFWVVALFGPLVVSLALAAGPVKRLLSLAPLVWVGEISYSMYMLHHFVIEHIRDLGGVIDTPFRIALTLALVIAVSSVSYLAIEKPARRMARAQLGTLVSPVTLALRSWRKG